MVWMAQGPHQVEYPPRSPSPYRQVMAAKRAKKRRPVKSFSGSTGDDVRETPTQAPRAAWAAWAAPAALGVAALYTVLLMPALVLVAADRMTAAEMLEYVKELGKFFPAALILIAGPAAATHIIKRLTGKDKDDA